MNNKYIFIIIKDGDKTKPETQKLFHNTFRARFYLILLVLMALIFYSISPQLIVFYVLFIFLSVAIVGYLFIFLPIFDTIEKNSSLKYWEIRRDYDYNKPKTKIWNFICSYFSLFWSNFLISIISIFFLYKLEFLSNNNDPSLSIFASTTIVILIRFLTYFKKEIAGEIGKGFRYAMFPLGFTLFFWDFLSPLIKKDPFHPFQSIYSFIIHYIPMIAVLVIALFVITGLEPMFEVFDKINRYYAQKEKYVIDWVVGKFIKKQE